MSRRRVLILYTASMVALFGALALVTWAAAQRARADTQAAIKELDAARQGLTPKAIESDTASIVGHLETAQAHLRSARSHLSSPLLAPVRLLPFVGRQLRAGIVLCDGAAETVEATAETVSTVGQLLREASPNQVLPTVEGLTAALSRAEARLAAVSLPPAATLVGPLRNADLQLTERLGEARLRLRGITEVLPTVRATVGGEGPRRYFLAVNNNAEMRGSGGMTLSFGILTFDGGSFRVDQVRSFAALQPEPGSRAQSVPIPDEMAAAFGGLQPGIEVRNTNVSAVFPQVAPILARIYAARTGGTVDGVISVDVVALQSLVAVTGPIRVPEFDQELTGDTTVNFLLSQIYQNFADDNEARRAALGVAAQAVAARLGQSGYSHAALLEGLAGSVRDRNVMIWSARGDEQGVLERAGLGGGFPQGRLPVLAAVENIGGTKLDYYVHTAQDLELSFAGQDVHGSLTLTLTNTVDPGGLPQYVVGPYEGLTDPPGTYRGLVAVWLPKGAGVEAVGGDATPIWRGTDAGYSLALGSVVIPPGATVRVRLAFLIRLAPGQEELPLTLLPQGRLWAVPARVSARLADGWRGPERIEGDAQGPISSSWRLSSAGS